MGISGKAKAWDRKHSIWCAVILTLGGLRLLWLYCMQIGSMMQIINTTFLSGIFPVDMAMRVLDIALIAVFLWNAWRAKWKEMQLRGVILLAACLLLEFPTFIFSMPAEMWSSWAYRVSSWNVISIPWLLVSVVLAVLLYDTWQRREEVLIRRAFWEGGTKETMADAPDQTKQDSHDSLPERHGFAAGEDHKTEKNAVADSDGIREEKQDSWTREESLTQEIAQESREMPVYAGEDRVLDVNRCTEEEFASLPGISAAAAKRMVGLRQKEGEFTSVDDFIMKAGIKPHFAAQLIPRLTASRSERVRTVKSGGRKLDI